MTDRHIEATDLVTGERRLCVLRFNGTSLHPSGADHSGGFCAPFDSTRTVHHLVHLADACTLSPSGAPLRPWLGSNGPLPTDGLRLSPLLRFVL